MDLRRWIDADTFEVFVQSTGSVVVDKESEEVEYIGGALLLTVKRDNKGGWKITRLRELSDAEAEELQNAGRLASQRAANVAARSRATYTRSYEASASDRDL